MGRQSNPPLSGDELERAANAAAAIITRCNMVAEDGFVEAEAMVGLIQRKAAHGMTLNLQ